MKQKILNTLRKLFAIPQMQWQLQQLQSNQMTKSDYRQFQLQIDGISSRDAVEFYIPRIVWMKRC